MGLIEKVVSLIKEILLLEIVKLARLFKCSKLLGSRCVIKGAPIIRIR